jgi:hypothetical protein
MLHEALKKGIGVEQIKLFQEMHREHEANEARKAFFVAMSHFRAESIDVVKNRHVAFGSGDRKTEYSHATLDAVVGVAIPFLSKHGLFHRWETVQENGHVTVSCLVSHEQGHTERTTLTASPDTSGSKNSIQAIGSTVSYLERYTFLAATGLAAKGMDNDGAGEAKVISESEVNELDRLIRLTNTDLDGFLEWAQIKKLEDLPAAKYNETINMLQRKKKKQDKERKEAE